MLSILAFSYCKAVAIKYPVGGTLLNVTSFYDISFRATTFQPAVCCTLHQIQLSIIFINAID